MTPGRGLIDLRIEGVGVIDAAAWDWGPGLTVITGETGSGKTMVLTGLALVLGGPSDSGLVRAGHATALVEGRFAVADPEALAIVAEAGGALDEDGSVVLSRSISASRSRAHLGGRTVPAATLAALGTRLVAVHGQDDQHRLLRPAQQRQALDRFGGADLAAQLAAYRESFDLLVETIRQRDDVVQHAAQRTREAEDLRETIEAIDRLRPQPGEEAALRAEAARLAHVDEIVRSAASAHDALVHDDGSASSGLGVAGAALARAAERDPELAEMTVRAQRLGAEVVELAADITRYLDAIDAEPGRVDEVEGRRAALGDLRRRLERSGSWPDAADDPAAWRDHAAARLETLGDDEGLVATLALRVAELEVEVGTRAGALSALRATAAQQLSAAVSAELAALAMGSTGFHVMLTRREGNATRGTSGELCVDVEGARCVVDRHGADEVEFMLVSRDTPQGRPLARSASGGERSRVMLALEVVFAGLDPVPTFVFDEVDAGVGGKAAVEVGHRLALLARSAQVIVVTHLAQVAAFADQHVVVRPGPVTASSISVVEGEERVSELARMLAGQEESRTAAAHARELVDLARGRLAAGRSTSAAPGR